MKDSDLKKKLTKEQYHICREKGTEPPFNNKYWDHKQKGIYLCICCGEPLFSSLDKYDSKTGWPSFSKPIDNNSILKKEDNSLSTRRDEVICRKCNSHLGHLFPDGPAPTHLRYCINSAALNFKENK